MVASGGWHCKELIGGAIISVAVAACFFAAFIAAALWLPQDQPTIRRHIVAAVLDGTFNARPSYGPLGATIFPRHTLDCTLANMMLAPPAGRLADAISNRHVALNPSWSDPRVPATTDCQGLARAMPELGPGYGDVQYVASDRYILGVRVVGRVLLSLMPFDTMARLLRGISFALLGVLGALALWKLRAAPDAAARQFAIGYLIIALCLALLYGVHWFDATLYFAPPDHVHFAFIIVSLLAPLARMRPAALALYCGELWQPDRDLRIPDRRHSIRARHVAAAARARLRGRAARVSREAVSALGRLLHRGRDLLRAQEGHGDRVSRRSGVVLFAPLLSDVRRADARVRHDAHARLSAFELSPLEQH